MKRDTIQLLVSFDKHYIGPFQVMLRSLTASNPGERFHIWLLHSAIPAGDLADLQAFCMAQHAALTPVAVARAMFARAPVSRQYPQEMYYRLLAPLLLPAGLERVLYLDPDILVLNGVRPLWELPLGDCVFAAASHSGVFELIRDVNRVRLKSEHDYYNTGVLLMDLGRARAVVKAEEVFACVRQQPEKLLLPDQDVFNLLYGGLTLPLDDSIWNYDARYYSAYLLKSDGWYTMDRVMENTVFLHFCGRQKPWDPASRNRFAVLYKHYRNLVRIGAKEEGGQPPEKETEP